MNRRRASIGKFQTLVIACLQAALASACQGTIGDVGAGSHRPEGAPRDGTGGMEGNPPPGAGGGNVVDLARFVYQCEDPTARGVSDSKLRRLTRPELVATLSALVGDAVMSDAGIQTQLELLTADRVITSIQDVAESPPDTQPAAMLEIALKAADLVLASEASTKKVFGECASTAQFSDDCLGSFVTRFGLEVYRRPVTDAESKSVVGQYEAAGETEEGMRRILARFLMSPSLVFHVEVGSRQEGARVRLTDHEVASRLAYRLTGTLPDAELIEAAVRGTLGSLDELRIHAKRLVSSPAVRQRVQEFFRFYAQLYSVPAPSADAARLNGIGDAAALRGEMEREASDFVDHVFWTANGGLNELLTSTDVFPRSSGMAKILETEIASGESPSSTTADHAGILLRPAFLADAGKLTRPYHRALRVRSGMLCETFGLPDPNAIAARQNELGDLSQLSNRERLEAETSAPLCQACHGKLNPVGFALEGHDQLGMVRSVESNFDETGKVIRTHPIDTHVAGTFIDDGSGEVPSFDGATDLVRALAAGKDARGCFARRVFEYQRVRVKTLDDDCALRDIEIGLAASGSLLDAFIASVVNEDIFYKAEGI
jgi:hypothetical protein